MKKIISQQWIAPLIAGALFLGACHLINFVIGWPSWSLRSLFDLDREGTIPTWFSSTLWLLCAYSAYQCKAIRSQRNAWVVLAAFFLLFSIDEVAQIHDQFGRSLYRFISNNVKPTFVNHNYWPLTLSPFILVGGGAIFYLFYKCFKELPRLNRKVSSGLALVLFGAVGLDMMLVLLKDGNYLLWNIEIILEETLEMIGAIFIFWGIAEYREAIAVNESDELVEAGG